jgi:RNA polymerase sigma-19 factor, ECF subfamily
MLTNKEIGLFNNRNPEVITRLHEELLPPIRLSILSIFIDIDEETMEDIILDSFIKLWDSKSRFITGQDLKNYLFIIVRNECVNIFRRNQNHFNMVGGPMNEINYELPNFSLVQDDAEICNNLTKMLKLLKPKEAQIAELSFIDGKKDNEIAMEINVSLSTVKRLKKFVKQKLKKLLNNMPVIITVIFTIPAPCIWFLSKKSFKILTLFNHFLVFIMDHY